MSKFLFIRIKVVKCVDIYCEIGLDGCFGIYFVMKGRELEDNFGR